MRWPRFCLKCWGTGHTTRWEPVPISELQEWQYAELLVNGGEYRRPVKEPCPACTTTTK